MSQMSALLFLKLYSTYQQCLGASRIIIADKKDIRSILAVERKTKEGI